MAKYFAKSVAPKLPEGSFLRFDIHQRITHFGIIISFLLCAFTGLPIKYSYTAWGQKLTNLWGGFDTMFYLHLTGGVLLCLACVHHLLYIAYITYKEGYFSYSAVPCLKDAKDLIQNIKYFLGLSKKGASFERYAWKEKFDYMAVFWGMIMIGGSGFFMWFPDWAAKYMPRWVIDSSRMAHSDEAVLAVIVIFVWHFYNVHFHPDQFPMSKVFLDGKINEEMMLHEHPEELARYKEELEKSN